MDEHDLLRRIADVEKAFESSGDLPRTVPPPCGWDISETEPTAVSSEDGSVGYVPQPLTVHVGARAVLPTAGGPVSTEPVFVALAVVRSLLNLVPDGPGGHTRMSECMAAVRQYGEKDLFPGGPGIIAGSDSVTPIGCPRSELNAFVVATRDTMLSLLNSVDIEPLVKRRLEGELRRPGDFLEPDDRGTFLGFVEPTGLTPEKQRNNARLDALAIFLHALRRDPYAVVVDALKVLRRVAVPPGLLSADPVRDTVIYRGTEYPVSRETCHFVRLLLEADGGYVTANDVKSAAGSGTKPRPDRLTTKLPAKLLEVIETDPHGSRLRVDLLLSNP